MNTKKVLEAIKEIPKPYTHIGMSQPAFSNLVNAIETGRAKQTTQEVFFAKFGYEFNETTWKKK